MNLTAKLGITAAALLLTARATGLRKVSMVEAMTPENQFVAQ